MTPPAEATRRRRGRADVLILVALLASVGLVSTASISTGDPSVGVGLGDGWGGQEPDGGKLARWMEAPSGTLRVAVVGRSRDLQLRLELASFAQPRRVAVTVRGRPAGTFRVGDGFAEHVVPLGLLPEGTHLVTFRPTPGPVRIDDVLGNGDPRTVSLRLRGTVIVEEAP